MVRFRQLLALIVFCAGTFALWAAMTNRPEVSTLGYVGLWIGATISLPIAAWLTKSAKA